MVPDDALSVTEGNAFAARLRPLGHAGGQQIITDPQFGDAWLLKFSFLFPLSAFDRA